MVDFSPGFARPLYDRQGVRATQMELRALEAGSYYWKVAAVDGQGAEGGFSDLWRFTLAKAPQSTAPPPPLVLEAAELKGNILHVQGRTEAGATRHAERRAARGAARRQLQRVRDLRRRRGRNGRGAGDEPAGRRRPSSAAASRWPTEEPGLDPHRRLRGTGASRRRLKGSGVLEYEFLPAAAAQAAASRTPARFAAGLLAVSGRTPPRAAGRGAAGAAGPPDRGPGAAARRAHARPHRPRSISTSWSRRGGRGTRCPRPCSRTCRPRAPRPRRGGATRARRRCRPRRAGSRS